GCQGCYEANKAGEGGAMNRQVLRITGYRFAATFARRRAGYLALVLLIGLVGGIAMASIAAARRTQSSFPAFLASTNPADLTFSTYGVNRIAPATDYSAKSSNDITRLAHATLL